MLIEQLRYHDSGLNSVQPSPSARRASRVYEHFPKLAGLRGSQAGNLSGGERQMLAVGRGLMANPKVLLLDDPLRAWHRSCCRRSGRCWPRSKTPA